MSIEDINITGTAYWYKQTDKQTTDYTNACFSYSFLVYQSVTSEQGNKTEKY